MINYVYDGSFPGLLTAFYESYARREKPNTFVCGDNLQESFMDTNLIVINDIRKADRMAELIRTRISKDVLKNIIFVYLSEHERLGKIIYDYINFGWNLGEKISLYLSDERVIDVNNLCRKVLGERHRMMGLIRFKQLHGDIYYASMGPDFNITGLLVPHFMERLQSQDWIIHDVKRNIAALYNKKDYIITEFSMTESPILHENEAYYQRLWKGYFDSAAIIGRINPSLQKKNMPKKYWKYLTEMQPWI